MKAVSWLIETGVFEDDALISELEKQNCPYKAVKYLDFQPKTASQYFPDHDCVLFRGSLGLGRDILRTTWIPGAYMDQKNLSCTTYYAHFGEYLLNNRYFVLPLAELIRRRVEILDYFGSDGELFIRPDSNMKLFRAGVFDLRSLNTIEALSSELRREKTTLVLVGEKKPIKREWRFFAYKDEIITGSLYLIGEEQVNKKIWGGYLEDYAAKVIKQVGWYPEILYTIDICESAEELHVLELGSFSCAGEYGCDVSLIVEAGVRAAREDWDEVNAS
ncbi:MAG: ATP-grasp domain-containing protein [Cyanobacteria bacterium J06581_3]